MINDSEKKAAARIAEDMELIQSYLNEKCIKNGERVSSKHIYAALKDQLQNAKLDSSSFSLAVSCAVRGGYLVGVKGKKGKNGGFVAAVNSVEELPEAEKLSQEIIDNRYVDNRGKGKRKRKASSAVSSSSHEPDPTPEPETPSESQPEPRNVPVQAQPTAPIVKESKPVEESKPELPKADLPQKPIAQPQPRTYNKFVFRHVWVNKEELHVPVRFDRLMRLVEIVGGIQGGKEDAVVVFNGRGYNVPNYEMFRKLVVFLGGIPKGFSEPVFEDEDGIPVELKIAG